MTTKKSEGENPTDQGTDYEVGYKKPPKNRQFGQAEGNPRNPGGWKKSATPRAKLEKILAMSKTEWEGIVRGELTDEDGKEFGGFEVTICETLLNSPNDPAARMTAMEQVRALCMLIDQVYGKSPQLQVTAEADSKEDAKAYIKGFLIP